MGHLFYAILSVIALILSIVTIHELGHYLVARLFNIKITEFSVGIGRVKFLPKYIDSRGTVWRIGLLPLGGYVAILNEDPNNEKENTSDNSLLPEWFYNILNGIVNAVVVAISFVFGGLFDSKMPSLTRVKGIYLNDILPIYRILIAIAGPLSNYLLSICLLFSMYTLVGREYHTYVISEDNNNFIKNDRIIAVDGRNEILNKAHLLYLGRKDSTFSVVRGDKLIQVSGEIDKLDQSTITKKLNITESVNYAFKDSLNLIRYTFSRLFGFIFDRSRKAPKLSGPIGIIKQGISEMSRGIYYIAYWTAILSISFCILNLIFIPPFDGGAILLNIIEMVIGKNRKVEEIAQNIALIVAFYFLISTTRNDLKSIIRKPIVIRSKP